MSAQPRPVGIDTAELAATLCAAKVRAGRHLLINELLLDVRGWHKLPVAEVQARLAADPLAVAAAWELTLAAKHLETNSPNENEFLRPFTSLEFLKHMIYLGTEGAADQPPQLRRCVLLPRRERWDALVFLHLVLRWAQRFCFWQPGDLRELKRLNLTHAFATAVLDPPVAPEDALLHEVFEQLGLRILERPPGAGPQKVAAWLVDALELEQEVFRAEQQKLDFREAGGTQNSLFVVRAMGGVDGCDVRGVIGEDMALIIDIGDREVSKPATAYLESHVVRLINERTELSAEVTDSSLVLRWYDTRLTAEDLGRTIYQALKETFILSVISVNLLFDRIRIASLTPSIYAYRDERAKELGRRGDVDEPFVLCRSCDSYAPYAFCVVSVDRPPSCPHGYDELATLAQFTRSTRQFTIDRGICQDQTRGSYIGTDKVVRYMSRGHVTGIQMHSLRENPHPTTALAQCVAWQIEELDVIGVISQDYSGRSPDGKTYDSLLARVAGRCAPGYIGVGEDYLLSPRFLAGEGGLTSVGWMNSQLKARLGIRAEHIATERDCVNLAGLKEHLAAWRHQ